MKRNTRWYLLAVIAGALLAGAALWAARAFPTAPVAALGIFGLAGGLLLFCGLAGPGPRPAGAGPGGPRRAGRHDPGQGGVR